MDRITAFYPIRARMKSFQKIHSENVAFLPPFVLHGDQRMNRYSINGCLKSF
jgi:hypothetical protein